MSDEWLTRLQEPGYDWRARDPAASESDLKALEAYCKRPLPADYATFMRAWGGAEVSFRDLWIIRLWRPQDISIWSSAYGFTSERMSDAVAFGDNGGGEALVFDIRPQHRDGDYPVLAVNFVSITWSEVIPVADSFRELLLLRRPLL